MIVALYDNKIVIPTPSGENRTLGTESHKMHTSIQIVESDDIATEGLTYSSVGGGYQCDGGTISDSKLIIKSMIDGKKVTHIGDRAFQGCSELVSIYIPDSVSTIGNNSFRGCSGLIGVVFPNSITRIGDCSFYACTSLVNIAFNGTMAEWNAIEKVSFINEWNEGVPATKVVCTDGEVAL